MEPIQWVTTEANPRNRFTGFDAGQTGWKLHAVYALPLDSIASLKGKTSLCGLTPRHGWGMDLFIVDPCLRCVAKAMKLGLEVPREIAHRYQINLHSQDDFNEWKKDPSAYNAAHQ